MATLKNNELIMNDSKLFNGWQLKGDFIVSCSPGDSPADMDDWKKEGIYHYFNPAHAPVANHVVCLVMCIDRSQSYAHQLCFTIGGDFYYRFETGGTWSAWKQVQLNAVS